MGPRSGERGETTDGLESLFHGRCFNGRRARLSAERLIAHMGRVGHIVRFNGGRARVSAERRTPRTHPRGGAPPHFNGAALG